MIQLSVFSYISKDTPNVWKTLTNRLCHIEAMWYIDSVCYKYRIVSLFKLFDTPFFFCFVVLVVVVFFWSAYRHTVIRWQDGLFINIDFFIYTGVYDVLSLFFLSLKKKRFFYWRTVFYDTTKSMYTIIGHKCWRISFVFTNIETILLLDKWSLAAAISYALNWSYQFDTLFFFVWFFYFAFHCIVLKGSCCWQIKSVFFLSLNSQWNWPLYVL